MLQGQNLISSAPTLNLSAGLEAGSKEQRGLSIRGSGLGDRAGHELEGISLQESRLKKTPPFDNLA